MDTRLQKREKRRPKTEEIGRKMIAEVWNACQRLDKYVQIGFNPTIRGAIFSAKWDDFVPKNYAEMKSIFQEDSNSKSISRGTLTIDAIIQSNSKSEESGEKKQKEDDDTGRYHSIINFPNFLLHVLKLFKGDPFESNFTAIYITAKIGNNGNKIKTARKTSIYLFTLFL